MEKAASADSDPQAGEEKSPSPGASGRRQLLQAVLLTVVFAAGFFLVQLLTWIREETEGTSGRLIPQKVLDLYQDDIARRNVGTDFSSGISLQSRFSQHAPSPSAIDPNIEAISDFGSGSAYSRIGHFVGRVDLLLELDKGGRVINPCTGTLLEGNLVLTAHHCAESEVNQATSATILKARLVLDYLTDNDETNVMVLPLNAVPLASNPEADFLVFELAEDVASIHGGLPLSQIESQLPSETRNDLFIIHHPLGRAQHLTRRGCRLVDAATASGISSAASRFTHSCGTLPGTSGAPIFDYASHKLIGIHVAAVGAADQGGRPTNNGFALPISSIIGCLSADGSDRRNCARR